MNDERNKTRDVLLKRQGMIFLEPGSGEVSDRQLKAVALELAELGYVPSSRLENGLSSLSLDQLAKTNSWMRAVLSSNLGANQRHRPLFRNFPEGVPDDTYEYWVRKVLAHFCQAPDQPCPFCNGSGTTHVLNPCQHIVCDKCFDGANYTACPICEREVDLSSPFFDLSASYAGSLPYEKVTFKLLDLGQDIDAEARALFVNLCERKQAMAPGDREDLGVLLRDYREETLSWLPETIPVRENIAIIFGALFQDCDPETVWPAATEYLTTATDILRFIAAYSGADPSLEPEVTIEKVDHLVPPSNFWAGIASTLGAPPPGPRRRRDYIPIRKRRFKVAKLRRPLRRAMLQMMEKIPFDRLAEDMLRHRSHWVWVGEFLHPHEHRKRFPNVARAFAIIRKKAPDGTSAPAFKGYYSRFEQAADAKDVEAVTALLVERPGELGRRFDHALRLAGDDEQAKAHLLEAFVASVDKFSTPVLLTLRNLLPTRLHPSATRIFWPKGQVAKGVSSPDERGPLPSEIVHPAIASINAELLRRFAEKPDLGDCIVDKALKDIVAPFNERTASPSAVGLPRGSRVDVPEGRVARMFLHWCQPETDGHITDLDLSVGFYDDAWKYLGVCSYYELKHTGRQGEVIGSSAGDRQDAPFPDGATEFVDIHGDHARQNGVRYAVMVVNSYAGMPFSLLDRAFAGLMLREDDKGRQFDPRTVELRFNLQGERGIYLPLVFDLGENRLHWLDVYSKGDFRFNNVETSNADIQKICPELMEYFGSGIRISMYELALLHAAARGKRVFLRGDEMDVFLRHDGESAGEFLGRLLTGTPDTNETALPRSDGAPVFAALYKGDIDLPEGSNCYALFAEKTARTISASDLIS